jgi:hypothetical protein
MRAVGRSAGLLVSAVSVLLGIGCGAPDPVGRRDEKPSERLARTRIDVGEALGGGAIRGVSHAADVAGALDLMVIGRGIVRVDGNGQLLSEHPLGQQGLDDRGYTDVASLQYDQFVLLSDSEGYLYDPATSALTVHFCVEPGWEEPAMYQRNDALAAEGNSILAAPRFYTVDATGADVLIESSLRTYRAGDGTLLTSVDLTTEGLELTGLAQAGDEIFGVQGNTLVRFSLAGELLDRSTLDGVRAASGIAVDLGRGEFIVADAERSELLVFPL